MPKYQKDQHIEYRPIGGKSSLPNPWSPRRQHRAYISGLSYVHQESHRVKYQLNIIRQNRASHHSRWGYWKHWCDCPCQFRKPKIWGTFNRLKYLEFHRICKRSGTVIWARLPHSGRAISWVQVMPMTELIERRQGGRGRWVQRRCWRGDWDKIVEINSSRFSCARFR